MNVFLGWRKPALSALTVAALLWLQPGYFPLVSLVLVTITWLIVTPQPPMPFSVLAIVAGLFAVTFFVAGIDAERGLAIGGLAFGVGVGCWRLVVFDPGFTSPPGPASIAPFGVAGATTAIFAGHCPLSTLES